MGFRNSNRLLLVGVAFAIAAGFAAWLMGARAAAEGAWAAATLAGLVPLAISIVPSIRKRAFGVDVIALLAMAGALALHEYLAGAVIALMFSGGRSLEEYAAARATRELSALLQRAPQFAHRYQGEQLVTIPAGEVARGDLLLVKPGEVIPVDGVVGESTAVLDESALTGEAKPVVRHHGEQARSGAVNASGKPFVLRATAPAEESTYAGVIRLVREAQESKAPLVRLADRYAVLFVPVTLFVSGLAWAISGDPVRALAVLVVATPCPLILAAPVAVVAGISRAARHGIIVKGGGALETLARGETLLLDKTGTVTAGAPSLTQVETFGANEPNEVLRLAASLDQVSPHVLAGPILKAAGDRNLELSFPKDVVEEFGSGIRGLVDGREVRLGKAGWVLRGAEAPPEVRRLQRRLMFEGASGVFVEVDGRLAGALVLDDPIRRDAPLTIRSLRQAGFQKIVLLTGDHADIAKIVGRILGVDRVLSERSPAEKVEAVAEEARRAVTVMVGDGINDAPALAAADVGVAMGARGATASSDAADVVLAVDRLDRLIEAVRLARRSRRIALESIWGGMALSVAAMGFAAAGFLQPVPGALLQEGIDVIVILNALRALKMPPRKKFHEAATVGDRFRIEHERLVPGVQRIRSLTDHLDEMTPGEARAELEDLHRFLVTQVVPHNEAEDAIVYPAVAKLIGGEDPTAVMSRAHQEISHLVNVFGRHLAEMAKSGPDLEDVRDLRRVLYGLDAILKLHFAQEDESYFALIESRTNRPEERTLKS